MPILRVIALLTAMVLCFAVGPVLADTDGWLYEVRLGVLDHDTDHLWSGESFEEGFALNAEVVFAPSYSIFYGDIRPNFGATISVSGDTSKVYLGGVYEKNWPNQVFFNAAFGGCLHDGELDTDEPDKKSLGLRFLLRTGFELGYNLTDHHRLSVMFDHISNGYFGNPNEGLDTLGIRYGYRF